MADRYWRCEIIASEGPADSPWQTHCVMAHAYGRTPDEARLMAERLVGAYVDWDRPIYRHTQPEILDTPRCSECGCDEPLTLASSREPFDVIDELLCVPCHEDVCPESDTTGGICAHCLPELNRAEREKAGQHDDDDATGH